MVSVFTDKTQPPAAAALDEVLGEARPLWHALVEHATQTGAVTGQEWKHYGKTSGWVFVLKGRKHNLIYLTPKEGSFATAMAYSERAVEQARHSDLPAPVLESIEQAKVYVEGRPVRVEVSKAEDLEVVKKLLTIKVDTMR